MCLPPCNLLAFSCQWGLRYKVGAGNRHESDRAEEKSRSKLKVQLNDRTIVTALSIVSVVDHRAACWAQLQGEQRSTQIGGGRSDGR